MPADAPMNLSEVTRLWDKGSKSQRVSILTTFLQRHRQSTAAEIERDLGHGSLLFFTRITAWLRLTYKLGTAVSLQLSALSVFLQGQKYLTQFMEVGGIQALTDLVCICKSDRQLDKNNGLLLLLHIANSGRVYREMVCDGEGIGMLVDATLHEKDDKTIELLSSLFLALGQGNPRKASAVHAGLLCVMLNGGDEGALCAATTLRSLQLAKQTYAGDAASAGMVGIDASSGDTGHQSAVLDSFFHLLSSPNVKLRFEGMELLSIAAQNHTMLGPVILRCLEHLGANDVTFETDPEALQPMRRLKSSCGRILCNVVQSRLPTEQAEHVLILVDRYSAHIVLARHLQLCEGRDVPGTVEACKTLRRLALGAFPSAIGTSINAAVTSTVSQWLRLRLGSAMLDAFIDTEPLSDELALQVASKLLEHEVEAQHTIEGEMDQEDSARAAAEANRLPTPQPARAESTDSDAARLQQQRQPACCPEHFEAPNQPSLKQLAPQVEAFVIGGIRVPANRVVTTDGMRLALHAVLPPQGPSAKNPFAAAPKVVPIHDEALCTAHFAGNCGFGEDCNKVHVCPRLIRGDAPEDAKLAAHFKEVQELVTEATAIQKAKAHMLGK
jgi:hypothetical protein